MRVQQVRFKSPGITVRRLVTTLLYTGCFLVYLHYVFPDVDDDEEEPTWRKRKHPRYPIPKEEGPPTAGKDEEDYDDDALFIPLGFAQKMPRTYYRGSDPEWQEFIKFAGDSKRYKAVQGRSFQFTSAGATTHKIISNRLGKDPKVGKHWLDVTFPDGPPQEYERSGLEIDEDYMAWVTKPVSQEQLFRVNRALWPTAAFNSVYASSRVLFKMHFQRVKEMLGFSTKPDLSSPQGQLQQHLQILHQQQQKQQATGKTQTEPGGASGVRTSTQTTSQPDVKTPGSKAAPTAADAKPSIGVPRIPMPFGGADVPIAFHVFASTLARDWMPKNMEAPRLDPSADRTNETFTSVLPPHSSLDPFMASTILSERSFAGTKHPLEPRSSVPAQMPLSTNLPTSFADGDLMGTSRMEFTYLAVYFAFNLALTLFNKAVMGKFPFPYLLTAIHTGCSSLGCVLLHKLGRFTLTNLTSREHAKLYLFSVLYTLNVAVSNLSLHHVTIPFHQVIRATTPMFTILIYRLAYSTSYATTTYTSLLPVILGVAIATYGDYSFTLPGLFLTLLGALLAALKTVATNRMQTGGLRLGALEILHRMSALAMVQSVALAYMSGEMAPFLASYASAQQLLSHQRVLALLGNGAIAFGLNVVSFAANKRVGALTMTVAANVKQTLTVVLGLVLFDVRIGALNAAGIALTLAGGAWYAKVEMTAKRQTQLLPTSADVSGRA
ncbi:hypothetical protein B0A49_01792 [Cryomyces minteri]|uniref:Sugar phosphate transporter domain-containing protein n=1 Tax=Cryomyces minteri TaxID=331657 RepID=A0A4U0XR70_9PEZI|nr:hypothetical protein B0A49_01792 [Cryomyces minteri]